MSQHHPSQASNRNSFDETYGPMVDGSPTQALRYDGRFPDTGIYSGNYWCRPAYDHPTEPAPPPRQVIHLSHASGNVNLGAVAAGGAVTQVDRRSYTGHVAAQRGYMPQLITDRLPSQGPRSQPSFPPVSHQGMDRFISKEPYQSPVSPNYNWTSQSPGMPDYRTYGGEDRSPVPFVYPHPMKNGDENRRSTADYVPHAPSTKPPRASLDHRAATLAYPPQWGSGESPGRWPPHGRNEPIAEDVTGEHEYRRQITDLHPTEEPVDRIYDPSPYSQGQSMPFPISKKTSSHSQSVYVNKPPSRSPSPELC